jgi:hypothetical protein
MQTRCSADLFGFAPVERRVVALARRLSASEAIFSGVFPRGRENGAAGELRRGADCDFLDLTANEGLVFAEIGFEAMS